MDGARKRPPQPGKGAGTPQSRDARIPYLENRILKIQKKISAVNCEAIYCEYRHPRSVTMGGSSGKAVEEAMGTDKKCVETGKLSKKYPPEA